LREVTETKKLDAQTHEEEGKKKRGIE